VHIDGVLPALLDERPNGEASGAATTERSGLIRTKSKEWTDSLRTRSCFRNVGFPPPGDV